MYQNEQNAGHRNPVMRTEVSAMASLSINRSVTQGRLFGKVFLTKKFVTVDDCQTVLARSHLFKRI